MRCIILIDKLTFNIVLLHCDVIILIKQLTFQNGNGHQGEEAVIYEAYSKIICEIGVQRSDKGSGLFHINNRDALASLLWWNVVKMFCTSLFLCTLIDFFVNRNRNYYF